MGFPLQFFLSSSGQPPAPPDLSLFRHLAAHHQYRHDHRHLPNGFLIQIRQNRDAKAVHLKLDELIRAVTVRAIHWSISKTFREELKKLEQELND